MSQLPLINEQLFKQHSPVTANTNIAEFVPYICIAQELHVSEILGNPLMDELQAQISENTLTVENSNLILRIAPALSFYAVYQALPFHWATIINKGITIRESENSKGIDIKDLAQLRQWIKNDADTLKQQLVDYLVQNAADYPLWRPKDKCAAVDPNEGKSAITFDSGFYFSRRK